MIDASDGVVDRSTEVYEELRGLIVRGRVAPGSRMVETDVAERLGVSRTPVRAAIQRLEQEGYILSSGDGRSRASVAPLTREDSRELFCIVGEIEGLAARWAAQSPAGARRQLTQALRRLNGEMSGAAQASRPDQNRVFDLDRRFHRTYVEVGAGPRLLALHDSIKPQAERSRGCMSTRCWTRSRLRSRSTRRSWSRSRPAAPTRRSAPCRPTGATRPGG